MSVVLPGGADVAAATDDKNAEAPVAELPTLLSKASRLAPELGSPKAEGKLPRSLPLRRVENLEILVPDFEDTELTSVFCIRKTFIELLEDQKDDAPHQGAASCPASRAGLMGDFVAPAELSANAPFVLPAPPAYFPRVTSLVSGAAGAPLPPPERPPQYLPIEVFGNSGSPICGPPPFSPGAVGPGVISLADFCARGNVLGEVPALALGEVQGESPVVGEVKSPVLGEVKAEAHTDGDVAKEDAAKEDAAKEVAPVPMGVLPSKGSELHSEGCRPCAFLWTKGCENGYECLFCHACDAGAKKRRHKERMQSRVAARKRQTGSGSDWASPTADTTDPSV